MPRKAAAKKAVTRSRPRAIEDGFELREIAPLTESQARTFEAYQQGKHLMLTGMAGTGKSFLSIYLAFRDLIEGKVRSVHIVRSTVPSRDMGFMPGTLDEKLAVFREPYQQIVNELFRRDDAWSILSRKGYVGMVSTSYLRGMTYRDSAIILDEFQNCTLQELDTVITRTGPGCRLMLCGDIKQTDLLTNKAQSGLPSLERIIAQMPEFEQIVFGIEDIVRSGLVRSYLLSKYSLGL